MQARQLVLWSLILLIVITMTLLHATFAELATNFQETVRQNAFLVKLKKLAAVLPFALLLILLHLPPVIMVMKVKVILETLCTSA